MAGRCLRPIRHRFAKPIGARPTVQLFPPKVGFHSARGGKRHFRSHAWHRFALPFLLGVCGAREEKRVQVRYAWAGSAVDVVTRVWVARRGSSLAGDHLQVAVREPIAKDDPPGLSFVALLPDCKATTPISSVSHTSPCVVAWRPLACRVPDRHRSRGFVHFPTHSS